MTVLTDAEMEAVWDAKMGDRTDRWWLKVCRAVEAAVLRAVGFGMAGAKDRVVPEVEARERERAACIRGSMTHGSGRKWATEIADNHYPSLKPVEPPPLVLGDGFVWYREKNGLWGFSSQTGLHGTARFPTPTCYTAADARALAEWLEKWSDK
jgi:hypothetical protein